MGKKRGSRATPVRRLSRVVNIPNANSLRRPTVRLNPLPSLPLVSLISSFTEVSDRRTYHPSGPSRSARSTSRAHHDLVSPSPFGRFSGSYGVGFKNPERVLVCIRRKQRREVLLAKGRGGANRKPRRSYYSDVRC